MSSRLLLYVMFVAGAVLIYSGIKNRNPVDVVKESLGQSSGGNKANVAQRANRANRSGDPATQPGSSIDPGLPTYVRP